MRVDRGILTAQREVGAGRAVVIDDAFGEQVVDGLACDGFVGGEDVIEGAVLADDDDHVLDRRLASMARFTVVASCFARSSAWSS